MIRVEESNSRDFIRRGRAAEKVLERNLNGGLGLFRNPPRLSKAWNSVKQLGSLVVAKFRRANPGKGVEVALDVQQQQWDNNQSQSIVSLDVLRKSRIQPPDFKALRRSILEVDSFIDFQTKRIYHKTVQTSIRDIENIQIEYDEDFMLSKKDFSNLSAFVNKLPPPQFLEDEKDTGQEQKMVEFQDLSKKQVDNHDIRSTKSQDMDNKDIGMSSAYDQYGQLTSQFKQEPQNGMQGDQFSYSGDQQQKRDDIRAHQSFKSECVSSLHKCNDSLPNNWSRKTGKSIHRHSKHLSEDSVGTTKVQENVLLSPQSSNNELQSPQGSLSNPKYQTSQVNRLVLDHDRTPQKPTHKAQDNQIVQMNRTQRQKTPLDMNQKTKISVPVLTISVTSELKQSSKPEQPVSDSFLNAFLTPQEKQIDFWKLIGDKTSTNTTSLFNNQQSVQATANQQDKTVPLFKEGPITGMISSTNAGLGLGNSSGAARSAAGMDMEMQQSQVSPKDTLNYQNLLGQRYQMQSSGFVQGFIPALIGQPQPSLFFNQQGQQKTTNMFTRSPQKAKTTLFSNQQDQHSGNKSNSQASAPKTNKKKRAYN